MYKNGFIKEFWMVFCIFVACFSIPYHARPSEHEQKTYALKSNYYFDLRGHLTSGEFKKAQEWLLPAYATRQIPMQSLPYFSDISFDGLSAIMLDVLDFGTEADVRGVVLEEKWFAGMPSEQRNVLIILLSLRYAQSPLVKELEKQFEEVNRGSLEASLGVPLNEMKRMISVSDSKRVLQFQNKDSKALKIAVAICMRKQAINTTGILDALGWNEILVQEKVNPSASNPKQKASGQDESLIHQYLKWLTQEDGFEWREIFDGMGMAEQFVELEWSMEDPATMQKTIGNIYQQFIEEDNFLGAATLLHSLFRAYGENDVGRYALKLLGERAFQDDVLVRIKEPYLCLYSQTNLSLSCLLTLSENFQEEKETYVKIVLLALREDKATTTEDEQRAWGVVSNELVRLKGRGEINAWEKLLDKSRDAFSSRVFPDILDMEIQYFRDTGEDYAVLRTIYDHPNLPRTEKHRAWALDFEKREKENFFEECTSRKGETQTKEFLEIMSSDISRGKKWIEDLSRACTNTFFTEQIKLDWGWTLLKKGAGKDEVMSLATPILENSSHLENRKLARLLIADAHAQYGNMKKALEEIKRTGLIVDYIDMITDIETSHIYFPSGTNHVPAEYAFYRGIAWEVQGKITKAESFMIQTYRHFLTSEFAMRDWFQEVLFQLIKYQFLTGNYHGVGETLDGYYYFTYHAENSGKVMLNSELKRSAKYSIISYIKEEISLAALIRKLDGVWTEYQATAMKIEDDKIKRVLQYANLLAILELFNNEHLFVNTRSLEAIMVMGVVFEGKELSLINDCKNILSKYRGGNKEFISMARSNVTQVASRLDKDVYKGKKRFDLKALNKIKRIENASPIVSKASTYFEAGLYNAIIRMASEPMEDNDWEQLQGYLAKGYYRMKNFDECLYVISQYETEVPKKRWDEEMVILKALIHLQLRNKEASEASLNLYLELFQDGSYVDKAHFLSGWNYLTHQEYQRAHQSFDTLVKLYPKSSYVGKAKDFLKRLENINQ